jgi:hypothetical protein
VVVEIEIIVDRGVGGGKLLKGLDVAEFRHRAFSSPEWLGWCDPFADLAPRPAGTSCTSLLASIRGCAYQENLAILLRLKTREADMPEDRIDTIHDDDLGDEALDRTDGGKFSGHWLSGNRY